MPVAPFSWVLQYSQPGTTTGHQYRPNRSCTSSRTRGSRPRISSAAVPTGMHPTSRTAPRDGSRFRSCLRRRRAPCSHRRERADPSTKRRAQIDPGARFHPTEAEARSSWHKARIATYSTHHAISGACSTFHTVSAQFCLPLPLKQAECKATCPSLCHA